jgi:hypothetical protein
MVFFRRIAKFSPVEARGFRLMRKLILPFAIITLCCSSAVHAETLNNEAIIQLTQAGLGTESIIAKIKSSAAQFDLSTANLIALKKANVPDAIIAAMLEASTKPNTSVSALANSNSSNPLDPHASGVYMMSSVQGQAKMIRLDPTSSAQTKNTGGIASALTYGIAKRKVKTVLSNPTARTQTAQLRPAFYFYFDQSGSSLSQGGQSNPFAAMIGQSQPVTSPNEFTLVRFDVKGVNREIGVGQLNIGGLKTGVMDKARIPFTYEELASGVFKVTPTIDLPAGEYGFLYASSGGGSIMAMYGMGGQTSKIFDFGVQ